MHKFKLNSYLCFKIPEDDMKSVPAYVKVYGD